MNNGWENYSKSPCFFISIRTFYVFNDPPPHHAWFHFHSVPLCRPVCGGNSWHYWHQSWMQFTTNNCLCKTSIYIMDHVVCRYPYSIDLELNKVKTIPTPGALACGWPPTLASLAVETINKVSQKKNKLRYLSPLHIHLDFPPISGKSFVGNIDDRGSASQTIPLHSHRIINS